MLSSVKHAIECSGILHSSMLLQAQAATVSDGRLSLKCYCQTWKANTALVWYP